MLAKKIFAIVISVLLLSLGWLSVSGLPLLIALVPLLWLSSHSEDSRHGWWQMFWMALAIFVLWNVTTVWWIWNATPVGPVAATLVSSTLSMIAFMGFHTISKRAPKSLSYTFLVSVWIALEYWYTTSDISWPWLLLGNGFSNDIWAVQWYEYTGLFGGSLWVLLSNITIFEAWQQRSLSRYLSAAVITLAPLVISAVIYVGYEEPTHEGSIEVSVVQPNVHFGRSPRPNDSTQEQNLLSLIHEVPKGVDFIVMPECTIPEYVYEPNFNQNRFVGELQSLLREEHPSSALVAGASTVRFYRNGKETLTARESNGRYYDIFNSALYIPAEGEVDIHHKAKLVIGTESTPLMWLFGALEFLVIDLGGTLGQLGRGTERVVFDKDGTKVGPAICYEALYGAYYGEFVQNGAEAMFIISNDCWWDNTPGYRHLFSMSALRAVEHRRAIARSANTGISGFINSRGDKLESMEWDTRGVLTDEVALNSEMTIYTIYGDYIARIAQFLSVLSLLYYMVYKIRKRNHLV